MQGVSVGSIILTKGLRTVLREAQEMRIIHVLSRSSSRTNDRITSYNHTLSINRNPYQKLQIFSLLVINALSTSGCIKFNLILVKEFWARIFFGRPKLCGYLGVDSTDTFLVTISDSARTFFSNACSLLIIKISYSSNLTR